MNGKQAILQRLRNRIGRLKYRPGERFVPDRQKAFDHYTAFLLRELPKPPARFELVSRRRLDAYPEGPATWELRFRAPPLTPEMEPGDLVYLFWRNAKVTVDELLKLLPPARRRFGVWSFGNTLCPASFTRVSDRELLESTLDLGAASDALVQAADMTSPDDGQCYRVATILKRCSAVANWKSLIRFQPRIAPRIYTVAGLPQHDPDGCFTVLISEPRVVYVGDEAPTIGRGAAYFRSLELGDTVVGYRLRHPNSLPCSYGYDGPGLAVVTGSAIAGVMAVLQTDQVPPGMWLVWGVRDRERGAYFDEILQQSLAEGRLARVDIVQSNPTDGSIPQRVQQFLEQHRKQITDQLNTPNAWVYISGQPAMGEQMMQVLAPLVAGTTRDYQDRMQWISST